VAKDEYPYSKRATDSLELKYTLCFAENVKEVRTGFFGKFYATPTATPDEGMLLKPFWSTWAQYKEAVNQSLVLQYARQVVDNGFGWSSHIEIDDDWETCYGEQKFNLEKFPDPAGTPSD
jgi:hypothetical protein